VKTTPSAGDYASAAVGTVLNAIYLTGTSAIPNNYVSIGVTVLQQIADGLNRSNHPVLSAILDFPTFVIGKITSWVQSKVDG
jgi:hypothetical protein